jgi:hypothetical protein
VSASREPPPPPKPNERKFPRFELLASVELHQGDETLILPARNLSQGGIYLAADGNDLSHLAIGTGVEVLVFDAVDETNPAVRAGAKVVRHDQDGIALQWNENKHTANAIGSLLRAVQPKTE